MDKNMQPKEAEAGHVKSDLSGDGTLGLPHGVQLSPGSEPKTKDTQPFIEHLRELRSRLIYVVATLFVGSIVGYLIHDSLFKIIKAPLHQQLYFTTITGGFNAILKISILFGFIISVPVAVYQLGKFLSPTFRRRIRAGRIFLASCVLAVLGILFAYYASLPAALHFLTHIGEKDLQPLLTVNEYLNFILAYLVGFAVLFQLPLILLFINRIKPQKPSRLMRVQRYVILVSFIIAAILTPTPDPMNQLIMALPIILLYQFSVGLIWFINRPKKQPIMEYSAAAYGKAAVFASALPDEPTPPLHQPQLISDIKSYN